MLKIVGQLAEKSAESHRSAIFPVCGSTFCVSHRKDQHSITIDAKYDLERKLRHTASSMFFVDEYES